MSKYVCSNCGKPAAYDGRCGDGPYLLCECVSEGKQVFVKDRMGGYMTTVSGAHPVQVGS